MVRTSCRGICLVPGAVRDRRPVPGHLFAQRWPEGFCCAGCGHGVAYHHRRRLIDECAACGKQHSLLAGTIFEQTKTGLARWFLASGW